MQTTEAKKTETWSIGLALHSVLQKIITLITILYQQRNPTQKSKMSKKTVVKKDANLISRG